MNPSSANDSLSTQLHDTGLRDREVALRLVQGLAGNGVTDDDITLLTPRLVAALKLSPDPDRALNSFARWFASLGSAYTYLQILLAHPVALDLFCVITGSSQYFADLLARHPEYLEIIANPGVRGGTRTAAHFQREVAGLIGAIIRPELKGDALRRWKAREMLRIGVRDLAGMADMPSTAREFSNLADACVQQALEISLATVPRIHSVGHGAPGGPPSLPFAVIGMGKLGGQELNYSSDIDLMFVTGDDLPADLVLENGRTIEANAWLTRLGESLIKVLSGETAEGHVFRVDMRLRPEGRFGALVRSLSSYRAYYENWAESWERQALLKARPVAGDAQLGAAFMSMAAPIVYRPVVSAEFVDEVRANKRRIEQKCRIEGETETNIKTGRGGIRDVEFIVQLMQLQLGGRYPDIRTPNTLAALGRLRHAGALASSEARELADDYQFLRTLEHRLQLLHRAQTQTLPPADDDRERTFLALRMGYDNRAEFEADIENRRGRISAHLQQLFYGDRAGSNSQAESADWAWSDVGDLLDNLQSPAAEGRLASRLAAAGFKDAPRAITALRVPMGGNDFGGMPPDTPQEFKTIAPRLLSLISHSAQPDEALAGMEELAVAVPNRAQLYASMDDSPDMMERLVGLAAGSPPLMHRLTQHLEWMEDIVGEERDADGSNSLHGRLRATVQSARERDSGGIEHRIEAIARFYLRETLRIGARDIWGWDAPDDTMRRLTRLAEAVLAGLLAACAEAIAAAHRDPEAARRSMDAVAALGLGKLGGAELGYASDWDLVFVYREELKRSAQNPEQYALAQKLVEDVNGAARLLATYGAGIEIDLRLRPWGRKGALLLTPRAYLQYLQTAGETWERQAALKARFIAGDRIAGARMEWIFRAVSAGRGVTAEQRESIVAMKRRIEAERLNSAETETDLKLGHGGLSDIEWQVQILQIERGKQFPAILAANTLDSIAAMADHSLLDRADTETLAGAYRLLTTLRNGLWLLTGQSLDALSDPVHRRAIARRLGWSDREGLTAEEQLWAEVRRDMAAVQRIFDHRFYRVAGL
jgi:[glutamine synthetase] adenylyltransferase / [glutamine synthetase]-adenylyl-L-tyrosine phosphorylase